MNKLEKMEQDKIQAEIAHLMAQTAKLNKEIKWYEIAMISAATLVIVAIAKLFI